MGNISSASEVYFKSCTGPMNGALGEVSCVRKQEDGRQQMDHNDELISSFFEVDPSLLSQSLEARNFGTNLE